MSRSPRLFLLFIASLTVGLLALSSCTDEPVQPPPDEPPVHTQQDTTSHNVTWEVYRLGRPGISGSIIRDIYALNDTDVWAVGRFVTNETDSVGNPTTEYYNAVHWDGKKWDFYRLNEEIYVRDHPREGTPKYVELYAVWVFGHNDLVACNGTDKVIWWDGDEFHNDINRAANGSITKMWARSKEDFYYCGANGTFGRFFNGGYHKINSHTNVRLNDVYGNNNEQVWTGGYRRTDDGRAFLRVDHGYEIPMDVPDYFGVRSHAHSAFVSEDTLYAFVGNAVVIQSIIDSTHRRHTASIDDWDHYGFIESMRGTGNNNIFAAGHIGTILHYNGKSWAMLTEPSLDNRLLFRAVSLTKQKVFIGGIDNGTMEAIVYIGTWHAP